MKSLRSASVFMACATAALTGVLPAHAAPTRPPLGSDFLWGVASSGFQSEGSAPDSNWRRYAQSGKASDEYRDSVDFYHRYNDDIALAKNLGVTVYRISVEWARVEPSPGRWDFSFYDSVLAAIHKAGMRPMITLDHWVYPGWAADRGGWRSPQMSADWLANAHRVVDRYASYNPSWVTINEPTAYIMNEVRIGDLSVTEVPLMADRLVTTHNAIYDYIHARQAHAMVTSNVATFPIPGTASVVDAMLLDRMAAKLDFVGLDYYYGSSTRHSPTGLLSAAANQAWNSPLEPEGIYYTLRTYSRKFPGKPLYIVENGMPTDNGAPRADGWTRANDLRDTVYWLQRAKADGIDIIGYNYWSLTDNYEWGSYAPRFGLYTVDVTTDPTLTRRPTDAVAAYRDITTRGGVSPDYRPTQPAVECSLVDAPTSCLEPVR